MKNRAESISAHCYSEMNGQENRSVRFFFALPMFLEKSKSSFSSKQDSRSASSWRKSSLNRRHPEELFRGRSGRLDRLLQLKRMISVSPCSADKKLMKLLLSCLVTCQKREDDVGLFYKRESPTRIPLVHSPAGERKRSGAARPRKRGVTLFGGFFNQHEE